LRLSNSHTHTDVQFAKRRLNASINRATFVKWAVKKFSPLARPSKHANVIAFDAEAVEVNLEPSVSSAEAVYDLRAVLRRLNVNVSRRMIYEPNHIHGL
jgi:hypothetical protein